IRYVCADTGHRLRKPIPFPRRCPRCPNWSEDPFLIFRSVLWFQKRSLLQCRLLFHLCRAPSSFVFSFSVPPLPRQPQTSPTSSSSRSTPSEPTAWAFSAPSSV